ncbi:signal transduction histidine kinase [Flavobacterium sp. CG_9.10]|uniref:tetratricopeptide repeat-containing sensor histidine kinase n=1 Tax=Flavobacterium sp. CG_9.10 TaxID=2787729 RepID=UPI0018CAD19B|nr:ATP-binding protein [Flavobacterium sp. CG_9.10]MBG6109632.1 signal transduction histidine kinase [Flavobacterium sp. CG_9.10]
MPQTRIILLLLFVLNLLNAGILAKEIAPSKNEITALAKEANQYMKEDQFEKSLVKSRIALQYAIAIKDDNLIATIYNTIGANFDEMTEVDKAFFYYNKGLLYANKTNNYQLKNWLYNNLGNIYCFDKKQYEKGIFFYKKSLEYSEKIKDISQTVFTKLNITWAYFDTGRFDDGYPYLQFINKFHKKYGDESTIVALNMLNGMYYNHKMDIEKADLFFQNAIRLGKLGNEKSDLSFSHLEYSKFLLKNGKYQKAYQNLADYNSITAELNNEEKLKKINVAGINLELDAYKREIDNIETKYETNQQLLIEKQYKNKQISVIIIASLLLIIILFYFFFQNTRLKQNSKLKDLQSQIQENIINASINGQEMERKKIASFLHDNISALLSSAGLHLTVFTSQNQSPPQEIVKTKTILKEAHDKVRDLSHELMPSLLARFGLFYALEDLCEKNSNSLLHFTYSSVVSTITRYDEDFEMKIYFIVTELLNNIIKHSQAGKANVTIQEYNESLQIHITDNGKGFDTDKFGFLDGFGLNQIHARINNLKGTIAINSKVDSGTSISIAVPIAYQK